MPTESNLLEHFFWQSCQDNLTANNQPKKNIYNNICLKFGIFVSLAAAFNFTGSNHVAQASGSDHLQASDSLTNSGKNKTTQQNQNPVVNFLPRLLHFVPFSTESLLAKSPVKSSDARLDNDSSKVPTISPLATESKPINRSNLLAQGEELEQLAQPRTHQVQRGETVSQIAKKYKVSSKELVKLNGIKNSNIIFVGQQLKIPPLAIGGISLDTSRHPSSATSDNIHQTATQPLTEPSNQSQSEQNIAKVPVTDNNLSRVDPTELNSRIDPDNPHIAKLRAEIESLRSQNQEQELDNNGASSDSVLNSQDVSSAQPLSNQIQSNRSRQSNTIAKSDLPELQYDLKTDLINEDVVALTLPPLPDSEEYLPSGFNGYIWPAQGVLTSGYGWRWGRMHRGIDIAAPIGTPIIAAASGKVIGAGWHGGYGNLIKIEHLDGSVTLYAHNSKILVSHGQKVNQGEQIAEMGSTGYSTGSHLHFEIHSHNSQVLDPLALLGSR
ncbi:MAG: peptidoglycan DD-metalloendopeptidase family protein [Cyanobacteria bacterium P01_G01_bin.39]